MDDQSRRGGKVTAGRGGGSGSGVGWPRVPGPDRVEAEGRGSWAELSGQVPELGAAPLRGGGAPGRRVVRLVSSSEDGELTIELQPGVNRIGRQRAESHIVLASPEVSRQHAEIEVTDTGIVLRDLGSANGTFVNGELVTVRELQPGDVVAFASDFSFLVLVYIALADPETETLAAESAAAGAAGRVLDGGASGLLPGQPPPHAAARGPASGGRAAATSPSREVEYGFQERRRGLPRPRSAEVGAESAMAEVEALERERRQLAVLYQVAKRCMEADTLAELDRLLVNVLERMVAFERGFLTYRLPTGDWKLVLTSSGSQWDRRTVRELLQLAMRRREPLLVADSGRDRALGYAESGAPDARLLLPLVARENAMGALFLLAGDASSFDAATMSFLELFTDIAALALETCGRLEAGG